MASTTAYAGEQLWISGKDQILKDQIYWSICRLSSWLEKNDYRGYDTFDGLNARFLRPFAFKNKFLLTALQQGVRRFPLNMRPFVGIGKNHSTKGMGFLARGFPFLHAQGDRRPRVARQSRVCPAMAGRKPIQRLQRIMLGKSLRLSVSDFLPP